MLKQPHVILLSCHLHNTDKKETINILSKITDFSRIPHIILISKKRDPNDFNYAYLARDCGAYYYLDEEHMLTDTGLLKMIEDIRKELLKE